MARNPGTHVRLPEELWNRIDRWRREHPAMPARPTAIRELVEFAFEVEALVDSWRKRQPDQPSRADAVRRLIERGLQAEAGERKLSSHPPKGKPRS